MTASEETRFKLHVQGAAARLDFAETILRETHERSDVTRAAARRIEKIAEELRDLVDAVMNNEVLL